MSVRAVEPRPSALLGTTWGNSEILAGGTDLLALMKDDVLAPKRLINIKEIKDLHGVSSSAQGLRIGALTTLGDLADDANVKKNYPAFAEALLEAASPQIRNLATLGGNLCQRPRCWYFRNGFGLVAERREPARNWLRPARIVITLFSATRVPPSSSVLPRLFRF